MIDGGGAAAVINHFFHRPTQNVLRIGFISLVEIVSSSVSTPHFFFPSSFVCLLKTGRERLLHDLLVKRKERVA